MVLLAQVFEELSKGDLSSGDVRVVRAISPFPDVQGLVEVGQGLCQPILRLQETSQVHIAGCNLQVPLPASDPATVSHCLKERQTCVTSNSV